ncbi:MAG: YSC84-related protein [Proteobacteria bacterium]|nr:YSC84-related protein [Pseudomonadota bacterium]
MKLSILLFACLLIPGVVLAGDEAEQDKMLEAQAAIREMRTKTLDDLYALNPALEDVAAASEAVAVFSSLGFNVFLLSTARGGGLVTETATGRETFMRMLSVGGGFGMGIKDFRVVFFFHTRPAYENFLSKGWDFSGQGDVAAEALDRGASLEMAASVVDGVSMYQLTENGLALQATLQGTKYYVDRKLNN